MPRLADTTGLPRARVCMDVCVVPDPKVSTTAQGGLKTAPREPYSGPSFSVSSVGPEAVSTFKLLLLLLLLLR